jgi:hypothetical protein
MPRTISSVRSPLWFGSDLSIAKQFLLSSVHEGINMELRLEAQNAFNHLVFSMGAPGPYGGGTLNVGDPSFECSAVRRTGRGRCSWRPRSASRRTGKRLWLAPDAAVTIAS